MSDWLMGWNWWRIGVLVFSALSWFVILACVAALCGRLVR